MNLEELRWDCAIKQKKGLHFILASVILWCAISVIHMTKLPIETKNLLTFCFSTPLLPLAFMISKVIKVEFSDKKNPLNNLGFLLSMNQMLYLLIVMWVYAAEPGKMVMVLAMVFGAHLLPFGWLYKSKSYSVMSVIITMVALVLGILFQPYVLAMTMVVFEIIFSVLLVLEVKSLNRECLELA